MPIVKVKDKFQITVPVTLRARLALKVGDLLEAEIKNGVLELSPKDLVRIRNGSCHLFRFNRLYPNNLNFLLDRMEFRIAGIDLPLFQFG